MLTKLKKDIDKSLKAYLDDSADKLSLKSASPLLYKGIKNFVTARGKRIRPTLFLISYMGYKGGKKYSYQGLIKASLSMELLHAFLLVHDDVIDNSDMRRGNPSLHRFFNNTLAEAPGSSLGPSLSIVAGDVIFALSMDALTSFNEKPANKDQALMLLSNAAATTSLGEFVDVLNNVREIEKVSKKDIFMTYTLKTAKYTFEAPLTMGATLAGASKKEINKLQHLGTMVGQAFQIYDDLLDIFSTPKKTGKPVLSDLSESKKTLLVWKTYRLLNSGDKKTFKKLLEKDRKTRDDLKNMFNLIKKTDSAKYCFEETIFLLDQAGTLCSGLGIMKKHKTALKQFIDDLSSKTKTLSCRSI